MNYKFLDELPTPAEYCELRKKCGLSLKTEHAATIGLPKSLYSITIREEGRLIGMGRAIGDLGCHVQITDIAVHPDFQKQGLGFKIMEKIMTFVIKECPECCYVNLFADVDFLYKKFGFVEATKSQGMYLDWTTLTAP
jgi:ribosomal protein S18 acetylase RimI-like enzyme